MFDGRPCGLNQRMLRGPCSGALGIKAIFDDKNRVLSSGWLRRPLQQMPTKFLEPAFPPEKCGFKAESRRVLGSDLVF
jgi:hypothetical protein